MTDVISAAATPAIVIEPAPVSSVTIEVAGGPQGDKGERGETGPAGLQGPAGPQGAKGDTGATGPQGPTGPQGATGPAGPTGLQGPKGDTGETGPAGPQGIQGIKGDKGDTGSQGPAGAKGDKGDTGETGPAGATGPAGQGVPTGGATGQVLKKLSGSDFDTGWQSETGGDHGSLAGLADDDHAQYHNDARGDARYYTKTALDAGQLDARYYTESEANTLLAGKADASHTHSAAAVTSGTFADARIAQSNVTQHQGAIAHQSISGSGTNTHAQIDSHIADAARHRVINDAGSGIADLWSASKISGELTLKADIGHAHAAEDITSGTFANARISQGSVTQHQDALAIASTQVAGLGTLATQSGGSGLATVNLPDNAFEHEQTVSASGVTSGSRILLSLAPASDDDENDPEMLDIASMVGIPGTDEITVRLTFDEPQSGAIKLNYMAI